MQEQRSVRRAAQPSSGIHLFDCPSQQPSLAEQQRINGVHAAQLCKHNKQDSCLAQLCVDLKVHAG